ncbi:MAG: AraC family transcriptional regulator [Verrucomicrobiota bacterium]
MANSFDKTAETAWQKLRAPAWKTPFRYVRGLRHALARGVTCRRHDHPALELVYHRRGGGVTRLQNDREIPFTEGSCVLYAPRIAHDQISDGPGEDWCLQVDVPRRLLRGEAGCLLVPIIPDWAAREIGQLTRPLGAADAAGRLILDYRASAVLLAVLQQRDPPEPEPPATERHVRRAEALVRRRFAEIETVAEIAREIGLSSDRLRHLYKEQRGRGLLAFLQETRLEHARSLLAHTGLPLKEIARLCGYRDEYYFSRVFRRAVGRPPGEYRRSAGSV